MYERTHLLLLGLLAGAAWGLVAYLLGADAFGPSIGPGLLASPLIGLMVAHLTHPGFARAEGWRRGLWSLASLYLGAMLFSVPIGLSEFLRRHATSPAPLEVALEPLLGILWGITLTGFVIALWPLAHWTHWLIERRLT